MVWSAALFCDGQAMAGPLPCSDWDAAGLVAEFFSAWCGGARVSVGAAVTATQRAAELEGRLAL